MAKVNSNRKVNEDLGEIVCDKCNGEGAILHHKIEVMDYVCPKCQGRGKVDWVENVVGVKPKDSMFSFSKFAATYADVPIPDFQMDFINKLSNELAKEIDNDIIRSLQPKSEHNLKFTWSNVKERMYDHRVIPKFMFYPPTKPEV
jgi:hypothetical protein